ncbi:glycosyltransferase [Bifidobacterium leontopitheci]|uniref:Glycosyltransferase, group 2 family protein n=1 Tax=Bifidobacterium leontopitheci TaxID=2650774 RepID=A0A6I1GD24_9BIFI|nr:glycosyltransferase family 2 protein [Bifidobacterium leontopitheci]KAB7789550.1 glycosyltransferase, group 2 family protein [Bifidobacterium leontopitheci]
MAQINSATDDLVSVIVPVYDAQFTLDRCLKSLLAQAYANMEIILVDDGSNDASPRLCDEWAKRDGRIKVVHQPNRGQAAARNTGLEHAHGSWIAFVDSDDMVEPDYLSVMMQAAMDHHADLVICSFYDHMKPNHMVTAFPDRTMSGVDAFADALRRDDWHYRPLWNRLHARRLTPPRLFPEGRACEDDLVFGKVLPKADCVVTLSRPLYHYMDNPASLTHAKASVGSLNKIEAYLDWYEFAVKHNMKGCYQSLADSTLFFLITIASQLHFISDSNARRRIHELITHYCAMTEQTAAYLHAKSLKKSRLLQRFPVAALWMLIMKSRLHR